MGCETRKLNHDNNTLDSLQNSSGSVTSIAFCSERIHGTHGFAVIALRQVKISCNVFFWNFSTFKSLSLIVASPAAVRLEPDHALMENAVTATRSFVLINTHEVMVASPVLNTMQADAKRRDCNSYKKNQSWRDRVPCRLGLSGESRNGQSWIEDGLIDSLPPMAEVLRFSVISLFEVSL